MKHLIHNGVSYHLSFRARVCKMRATTKLTWQQMADYYNSLGFLTIAGKPFKPHNLQQLTRHSVSRCLKGLAV